MENFEDTNNSSKACCGCRDCDCQKDCKCKCCCDPCSCGCGCESVYKCQCSEGCSCGCFEKKNINFSDSEKSCSCSCEKCTCDKNCDCGCCCNDYCECDSECCVQGEDCCKQNKSKNGNENEADHSCGCNIVGDLIKKIFSLKADLKEAKWQAEKKIFEFAEKKSKEIDGLLSIKKAEIQEKLAKDYESKLKYQYEKAFGRLTEIVSQFESVIKSALGNKEVSNYLVGFKIFLFQFEELFSEFGIKPIDPQIGDEFDSDIMEAMSTADVWKDDSKANKVNAVFSKGYKLHERVIKLASVEVNKAS